MTKKSNKCNCWCKGRDNMDYHVESCPARTRPVVDHVAAVRAARRRDCDRLGIPYSWEGVED